jgi:alpha-glucuronidase
MNKLLLGLVFFLITLFPRAEDGYRLWLRYDKIADATLHQTYSNQLQAISILGTSPSFSVAKAELLAGLQGFLGKTIPVHQQLRGPGIIVAAKDHAPSGFGSINYDSLGKEGFAIYSSKTAAKNQVLITANTDIGILYGVFHFLRLLQTHQSIQQLTIKNSASYFKSLG